MPKFQYSAINPQGKNLNGIINAQNQDQARQKLKSLKLTIIGIEEIPENSEDILSNQKNKYKFEARNKEDKKVIGSIEGDSIFAAFQRLVKEYELKVEKLADINASEAEFETSIPQVNSFYQQIGQLEENLKNDNSQAEYEEEKKQEEFRRTLEEIIQILNSILNKYKDDLNPKGKAFLAKYIEHLNKIKFSQNYDNVLASANKILKYFQNTILYSNAQNLAEEKLAAKLELMQKIAQLKKLGKNNSQLNSIGKKLENTIGLELGGKAKKENSTLSKILNELNIIFNSRSNNLTKKLAFKDIFQNLKLSLINSFKPKAITPETITTKASLKAKNKESQLSKVEEDIKLITFILLSFYLAFYFFSIFLSEKILKTEISQIFYIYQSNFLIYFISGVILLHSAINLRFFMNKHKIEHSKVAYILFGLLFILILINF